MNVIITAGALKDLDDIYLYLAEHYPNIRRPVAYEFGSLLKRLGEWPSSGRKVEDRSGIRVVVLTKHPYKIYYKIGSEFIEVLHVYHSGRNV